MVALEIPELAAEQFSWSIEWCDRADDPVEYARRIALPVVAAELRRIADMFESNVIDASSPVLADVAYLRKRAAELDGEVS